ncbi:MAG: hypothetical protein R3336_02230 [Phycisphaeraceae bacterium]|nr:hypothetical protein [Phycisphaeraceae bacterium]
MAVFLTPAAGQEQATPESLWNDFNHYVRIARPDLAEAAAVQLMSRVNADQLLDVVEQGQYDDWEQTIIRASKMNAVSATAEKLDEIIQAARVERSREPERIRSDIRRLAEGPRSHQNAIERLRAAGQYAAPHLLATLLDQDQKNLHPYVLGAIVSIGRPMVYPLSVSLKDLEPVALGQVAQALAEIGYPRALPYIREVLEDRNLDSNARNKVQIAHDRLLSNADLDSSVSAAELFLTLAGNLYDTGTTQEPIPGFDSAIGKGIVWEFGEGIGLVPIEVPGAIYGDVLAMRASRRSLRLDPELDPSLSLWLSANLRRENRLQEGQRDLSYGFPQPSIFYARAAGPLRQHDVLYRALEDGDTPLALDAISALDSTAGTDALVNREGTIQPLLRAMSYPDRRVRFAAAFTLANAHPQQPFPGSFRVVPVLAEAARQTDERFALVITPEEDQLNELKAMLRDLDYQAFGGKSIEAQADAIHEGPGIDLIVVHGDEDLASAVLRQTEVHYKLAAVPILALGQAGTQAELRRRFPRERRLLTALVTEEPEEIAAAAQQAAARYAGSQISSSEASNFAKQALNHLKDIAIASPEVFRVLDAEDSLIAALDDSRDDIVVAAGDVLSLLDSAASQKALAEKTIDPAVKQSLRIALLGDLAESATTFGNRVTKRQSERLLEIVKTGEGDLAVAAARAHGALTLPTANVVDLIVD